MLAHGIIVSVIQVYVPKESLHDAKKDTVSVKALPPFLKDGWEERNVVIGEDFKDND